MAISCCSYVENLWLLLAFNPFVNCNLLSGQIHDWHKALEVERRFFTIYININNNFNSQSSGLQKPEVSIVP